ncbi:hypothetical protein RhiTH_007470 [Rhizoctonia solani]
MKLVCEKLPTTNAENSKKQRALPTNYFGPTQFAMIERAAALCGFLHPELIVKELKLGPNGTLFQALQRGTVFHWIKDNHSRWTNKVMDCVAHAAESKKKVKPLHVASKGSKLGWPAQLDKYPQVLKNIVQLLSNIQCAGCLITRSVTQGYNIPPKLIINTNQTGVSYLGTGTKTWELQGSSQVSGVGKEEKQQFMLMAAVTAAGQILPYQAIYKGQTAVSLPSVQADLLS